MNVASGAFVRLRQATTTPGSTSAMRSQTWTVSVMGRLPVRIVPVESGFTSLAAMSFWAPASRRLGHDVAVREVGLVAGQELRLLLAPCTMSCAGAHQQRLTSDVRDPVGRSGLSGWHPAREGRGFRATLHLAPRSRESPGE